MSGASWGNIGGSTFFEEDHETGYCLELWGGDRGLIGTLTVPEAEELSKTLLYWAKTMRDGGHYIPLVGKEHHAAA